MHASHNLASGAAPLRALYNILGRPVAQLLPAIPPLRFHDTFLAGLKLLTLEHVHASRRGFGLGWRREYGYLELLVAVAILQTAYRTHDPSTHFAADSTLWT